MTSCTGEKAVSHTDQLTFEDFKNPDRLARKEVLLAQMARPAGSLYTGDQHRHLMAGVRLLREKYGHEAVHLRIISAGYGLVEEERSLVPYECTFNSMPAREAREWVEALGIPRAVREVVVRFPLVIFLLGGGYLKALAPPLLPASGQRFVFLAGQGEVRKLAGRGVTVVPAGVEQTRRYGSGLVGLKGKMFRLFAAAATKDPAVIEALNGDDTAATFNRAVEWEAAPR